MSFENSFEFRRVYNLSFGKGLILFRLTHNYTAPETLRKTDFENNVGNGENALNHRSLQLEKYYLSFQRDTCTCISLPVFRPNSMCRLHVLNLGWSKILSYCTEITIS